MEGVVASREPKEHLVRLLFVPEARRGVGLDKVEVEVARRHGRRPLVRRAEEEVAQPRGVALPPLQLVLPNLEAGHVGCVFALQDGRERLIVVAVELRVVERFCTLLDLRVVVVRLLEVEIVLAVVRIGRYELPAHGPVDFAQDGLDLREEVVGRLAPQPFDARLVEAQRVAELVRRGPERRVDVVVREPVNGQCVDDPQRHRAVRRPCERPGDAGLQHLAAVDDRLDLRHGAERRVLSQRVPVRIVGDQAGTAGRWLVVDDPVHGQREGLQHLALLDHRDPLKGIDEIGVDREQPHELVQPLVHVAVEPGERLEVGLDSCLLLGRLLQETLGHHVLDVGPRDADLLEAVLHAAQTLGHVGEPGTVEDGLLQAGDEAEP